MKIIHLLTLLVFITTNGLSQSIQDSELQEISIEQLSENELDELDGYLHLSQEQKEQVYEIIHGILIKNNQVKLMKLIEEDKKAIIERNKVSKFNMIMNVLVGKQKPAYENHVTPLIDSDGSPAH